MAYTLSNALQGLYRKLGQSSISTATTTDSTSTTIDTKLAEKFDDDFCAGGGFIVIRDAGGLSAAPEGQFGSITAYDSGTQKFTHSTLTAATASGDTYMYTTSLFPLYEMVEMVNYALTFLGKIPLVDTSITTANQQTEYSLPLAAGGRDLIGVELQTENADANDNQYIKIPNYQIIPATAGTQWTLVIPQCVAGYKVRVTYVDFHPVLTAYNSSISTSIAPSLLEAVAAAHAVQWYNRKSGGGDDPWREFENQAWAEVTREMTINPIWRLRRTPRVLDLGISNMEDGVPDPIT